MTDTKEWNVELRKVCNNKKHMNEYDCFIWWKTKYKNFCTLKTQSWIKTDTSDVNEYDSIGKWHKKLCLSVIDYSVIESWEQILNYYSNSFFFLIGTDDKNNYSKKRVHDKLNGELGKKKRYSIANTL